MADLTGMMQAAAGGGGGDANYIEDVFSTYLYTGNGSTQTITNGIDLAGKGGLVWGKNRAAANEFNRLSDTVRGGSSLLFSNTTSAAQTQNNISAFNSNGFTFTSDSALNYNNNSYVAWTFRKQPKFFDVVTYTGTGSVRTVAHNLGSAPGCIIVKKTSGAEDWNVYHRSLGNNSVIFLNYTDAQNTPNNAWNATSPSSTNFTLSADANVNGSGSTYVAYLFAHDAEGFGLSGNENVVSCGSFTADGSGNASVTLGYEPQFWLYKPVGTGNWTIYDIMRGWSQTSIFNLNPNTSGAEGGGSATAFYPTATGFDCVGGNLNPSAAYIYIAIRRGPMKVPTLGTTVFTPLARTGTNAAATITGIGFPPDLVIGKVRDATFRPAFMDRLRGTSVALQSSVTDAEVGTTVAVTAFGQNGVSVGADSDIAFINYLTNQYASWFFRRAPSFFDEVCYTGTGNPLTLNHNLGVAPELILYKSRSNAQYWLAQSSVLASVTDSYLLPNYDSAAGNIGGLWRTPSATTFGIALSGNVTGANVSSQTYVAYLFATCAGVSKVGSYTGTGTTQAIACGFAAGARFVMIKRTDAVGDWYVWDSARGIVAGNDPYLLLNSTAAEVTSTDYVDTAASGFELTSTAPAAINASGGSFVFLAIS